MRIFTFALGILFLTSVLSANTPVAKLVFSNPQEGDGISFQEALILNLKENRLPDT